MNTGLIDRVLCSEEILSLPDISIDVQGIAVSTHDLANAGWCVHVRRKYRSACVVRVIFNKGSSFLSCSAKTQRDDVEYIWSILERAQWTDKARLNGLHQYEDSDLLKELRVRNKVKRKKPVRNNVVNLSEYMERFMQEKSDRQRL